MTLKQSSDDCENLIKLLKTIEKKHVYLIVHLTTGLQIQLTQRIGLSLVLDLEACILLTKFTVFRVTF